MVWWVMTDEDPARWWWPAPAAAGENPWWRDGRTARAWEAPRERWYLSHTHTHTPFTYDVNKHSKQITFDQMQKQTSKQIGCFHSFFLPKWSLLPRIFILFLKLVIIYPPVYSFCCFYLLPCFWWFLVSLSSPLPSQNQFKMAFLNNVVRVPQRDN